MEWKIQIKCLQGLIYHLSSTAEKLRIKKTKTETEMNVAEWVESAHRKNEMWLLLHTTLRSFSREVGVQRWRIRHTEYKVENYLQHLWESSIQDAFGIKDRNWETELP